MDESAPRRVSVTDSVRPPRLLLAGAVIAGLALGGLVDALVLHHLLQWHNLTSAVVTNESLDGLKVNQFRDGLFYAVIAVLIALAVFMLWGARPSDRRWPIAMLAGFLLLGWGGFNIVDQLVFHLALGLHHIREDVSNYQAYDWGFFGVGVLFAAFGWLLARSARGRATPAAGERRSQS